MTIQRKEHWATRDYHQFLLSRASMPFGWGQNDCALFAADGILAITGVDIAVDFRGKYSDERSAFATIKFLAGGKTVGDAAAWCARKFGLVELQHPLMAQRGDLVVFQNGENLIAGLVHLNGRHMVSVSESGAVRFPITDVKRAWRV
jgi:hypothetical protein